MDLDLSDDVVFEILGWADLCRPFTAYVARLLSICATLMTTGQYTTPSPIQGRPRVKTRRRLPRTHSARYATVSPWRVKIPRGQGSEIGKNSSEDGKYVSYDDRDGSGEGKRGEWEVGGRKERGVASPYDGVRAYLGNRRWRALASSKTVWYTVVVALMRGHLIEKPFFLGVKDYTAVQLRELVKLHVRGPESCLVASGDRATPQPTITRRLDEIATQDIRGYLRLPGGGYIWLVYSGDMRVVQISSQEDNVEQTADLVEVALLPDRELIILRPSDELLQDEYIFTRVDLSSGCSRFLRLGGTEGTKPHLFGHRFIQVARYQEPDMLLILIDWQGSRYTVLKCPRCQRVVANVLPGHIVLLVNRNTSASDHVLIRLNLSGLEHRWTAFLQSAPIRLDQLDLSYCLDVLQPPVDSASAIAHDILQSPALNNGVNGGKFIKGDCPEFPTTAPMWCAQMAAKCWAHLPLGRPGIGTIIEFIVKAARKRRRLEPEPTASESPHKKFKPNHSRRSSEGNSATFFHSRSSSSGSAYLSGDPAVYFKQRRDSESKRLSSHSNTYPEYMFARHVTVAACSRTNSTISGFRVPVTILPQNLPKLPLLRFGQLADYDSARDKNYTIEAVDSGHALFLALGPQSSPPPEDNTTKKSLVNGPDPISMSEQISWFEPYSVEGCLRPRSGSSEGDIAECTNAEPMPETPEEFLRALPQCEVDKDVKEMTCGPKLAELFWPIRYQLSNGKKHNDKVIESSVRQLYEIDWRVDVQWSGIVQTARLS
ncbi:hypothetical protein C8R46DRAFT_1044533 [Mycena filopes]|nr:hypothetical protein C8R46DRAFT_1044533 [Mycena filopes]